MNNQTCPKKDENTTSRFTSFTQFGQQPELDSKYEIESAISHQFLSAVRRYIAVTFAVAALCLLSLTNAQGQGIPTNAIASEVPISGTGKLNNNPCESAVDPVGEDPNSLQFTTSSTFRYGDFDVPYLFGTSSLLNMVTSVLFPNSGYQNVNPQVPIQGNLSGAQTGPCSVRR
jgi:hypothetical protein